MRRGALALLCALACALVATGGQRAAAATTTGYASWSITGASTDYGGTVGLATGFPAVSYTSNSLTPPTPAVASGSSAWLPSGTPFADVFGSSQDQPYLNLRPKAYNAGAPSTTTYTFARPTPVGTWGISLGDVDAETLTVSATGVGGAAVPAAELGLGTPYNYCDATPRSATCTGTSAPFAVPTATLAATAVTLADTACPGTTARCNTTGEAAFFVPQVPLTSLTVVSTWKQGLPSYQTWFATLRGTIGGSVTDACGAPAGLRVQLLDSAGTVIGSQAVVGGNYTFDALARGEEYWVRVDPATLPGGATSATQQVGSLGASATAPDLAVREPQDVTGSVTGDDVGGLSVTLDPTTGAARTTTTTVSGTYTFAGVPAGDYTVTVAPGPGHTVDPAARSVTVACAAVDVDSFAVTAVPTSPPPSTPPSTHPSTTPSSTVSGTPSSTASSGSATDTLPASATTSPTSVGVAPTGLDTTPPAAGGLANTGPPVASAVAAGVVAIVVGAGLVFLARRRIRPRRA